VALYLCRGMRFRCCGVRQGALLWGWHHVGAARGVSGLVSHGTWQPPPLTRMDHKVIRMLWIAQRPLEMLDLGETEVPEDIFDQFLRYAAGFSTAPCESERPLLTSGS
jgi:hypothetical protein